MSNPFDQFDGGNPFDKFTADPKIGQPEDLSFAEKYVAPFLEKLGVAGNLRGSAVGRVMQGAADPGVAAVQLVANAVGAGDSVNAKIASKEKEYQDARKQAGSEGFDPLRAVGSTAILAPLGGVGAGVARGAAMGAATGALDPVHEGDHFWGDKAKQVALGAVGGAAMSPLMGALARLVSPKASVNPNLQLLRDEGVNPSIGQTLGGWANKVEEKAQSIPILGDAISSMRKKALEEFDRAAINRATAPIGQKVSGSGHEAVAEAGDLLSHEYQSALGNVSHVDFNTPGFNANFGQLQSMASGLKGSLAKKFDKTVEDIVLRKMSPNGSILGSDLKAVDSELGTMASEWRGSSLASEREFGDAVAQLQTILKDEVKAANPAVAKRLDAADEGWANVVRVEGAAKAGKNSEGLFTPAQLNTAIQTADKSVRKRAVGRGEALMQDLGSAGQAVLGNKVPDSGTTGRLLMNGGALASALIHPAIPAALVGGAAMYTKPVQNALRALVADRPDIAPDVANYLRRLTAPAAVAATPAIAQARDRRSTRASP